jgi:hypothetical protein
LQRQQTKVRHQDSCRKAHCYGLHRSNTQPSPSTELKFSAIRSNTKQEKRVAGLARSHHSKTHCVSSVTKQITTSTNQAHDLCDVSPVFPTLLLNAIPCAPLLSLRITYSIQKPNVGNPRCHNYRYHGYTECGRDDNDRASGWGTPSSKRRCNSRAHSVSTVRRRPATPHFNQPHGRAPP